MIEASGKSSKWTQLVFFFQTNIAKYICIALLQIKGRKGFPCCGEILMKKASYRAAAELLAECVSEWAFY